MKFIFECVATSILINIVLKSCLCSLK